MKAPRVSAFLILFGTLVPMPASAESNEPIKIGMTGPLTGPTAPNGLAVMHGTQALFKRINDAGGVLGRKLELVHFDDGYEPDRTIQGYEKLVKKDKVFALLTVYGAPNTQAIAPAIDRDDVPLVGPISAANLTDPVRKNIFMVRMSAYDEAEYMVEKAVKDLGVREFGIFFQDDAFGTSGRAGAQKALAARGLDLKAQGTYKRNTSEVKVGVASLLEKKPPAVVITGLAPASVEFIKEMTAKGSRPIYFGGSAVSAPLFIKQAAELKVNYFSALATPLPTDTGFQVVKQYQADMKAAGFDDADHVYGLEGYINAWVLVEGLKAAGSNPTRDKFRSGLESLRSLDVGGVTVSYSPTNHKGLMRLYMTKLEGGKLVPVTTLSLSAPK